MLLQRQEELSILHEPVSARARSKPKKVVFCGFFMRHHMIGANVCDRFNRIPECADSTGISRNTVRRYLRSETTEPAYAERQSASAIDPYAFQLSGWLKTEAAKSRKQRRSLKQLHEDLSELGFKGSYDRVAAFARQWREGQTEWVNSARKRTGGS